MLVAYLLPQAEADTVAVSRVVKVGNPVSDVFCGMLIVGLPLQAVARGQAAGSSRGRGSSAAIQ